MRSGWISKRRAKSWLRRVRCEKVGKNLAFSFERKKKNIFGQAQFTTFKTFGDFFLFKLNCAWQMTAEQNRRPGKP